MKRTIYTLAALCATALPGFCGNIGGVPEPKSSSWMYGVALAGIAGFAFFKRNKSSK